MHVIEHMIKQYNLKFFNKTLRIFNTFNCLWQMIPYMHRIHIETAKLDKKNFPSFAHVVNQIRQLFII